MYAVGVHKFGQIQFYCIFLKLNSNYNKNSQRFTNLKGENFSMEHTKVVKDLYDTHNNYKWFTQKKPNFSFTAVLFFL